jgi:hypothetical protein
VTLNNEKEEKTKSASGSSNGDEFKNNSNILDLDEEEK